MRLGMVWEPVLAILQLAVLSIRDGPDPAAPIHAQASQAPRVPLVRICQADQVDRWHGGVLQVSYRQIAPLIAQVLKHQPAMAVPGGGLAAQQDRGNREQGAIELVFDLSI